MIVILLLIPLSVLIAAGFLFAFIWAVRSGQFEDTTTPSLRVLVEEPPAAAGDKAGILLSTQPSRNHER